MEVVTDDVDKVVDVLGAPVMVEEASVAKTVCAPPSIEPAEDVPPEVERVDEPPCIAPGYMLARPTAIIAIANSAVRPPKSALSLTEFALSP